jgi:hypothetical protein
VSRDFDIDKKKGNVKVTAASKVYDGTAVATITECKVLDGTQEVGICSSTSAAFDSPAVGARTVTVSGLNVASGDTVNYTVDPTATTTASIIAWTESGFYQPVTMTTGSTIVYNTVKGGSTVPLKFNIYAGAGGVEKKDTSAVKSFAVLGGACSGAAYEDPVDFTTTGGTSLRYDTTAGQFIQNWKTPNGAGQCYMVVMTAQDGSTISAYFKTK